MATHCLPSGSLGTNEIPVAPINATTITTTAPGAGPYRGVVVFAHGLQQSKGVIPPGTPADAAISGFSSQAGTLAADLNAAGWIQLDVPTNGDNFAGESVSNAIATDIQTDTGTRYRAGVIHWWDHVLDYVARTYGASWPVVLMGTSWGGLQALAVLQDATRKPTAAIVLCPATVATNLNSGLWQGATLSNSSGLDISTSALNAYAGPTLCAYGTADALVGWSAGSSPVSTFDALITNAVGAGRPCTRLATHFTFHGYDATDEASIMSWMGSAVHPLAPKNL